MLRIFVNLLIVLSVFILPVYLSIFLILVLIFIFNNFIEAVVLGFLVDLLYGGGSIFGIHFAYFFTIMMLIFYLISFKLKHMIRLSSQ